MSVDGISTCGINSDTRAVSPNDGINVLSAVSACLSGCIAGMESGP